MQDVKNIWIVGGGIAGMAAAAFAIRDGKYKPSQIHILEESKTNGGGMDGGETPDSTQAWVTRGGRMFTDETYLCTWDLFSTIPSLENPDVSVRAEVKQFNQDVITNAKARLIDKNHNIINASELNFSNKDRLDLIKLIALSESALGSKRIDEIFNEEFFTTNFWQMWRTTFAFQKWHSAIELRRYFIRFIQEFPRIHTLAGVRRTKYNQYDSMIYPLQRWLIEQGVDVRFGHSIYDVDFVTKENGGRYINKLYLEIDNQKSTQDIAENELVFLTLGSLVGDTSYGSNHSVPKLIKDRVDHAWRLWENIAPKAKDFGRPMSFYGDVDEHKWESFTLTMSNDRLIKRIEEFSKNNAGTGGLMTFFESGWHISLVIPYQPHFAKLPKDTYTLWGYGFQVDNIGDYVKKKMSESTGAEILTEVIHHLGFDDMLADVLATTEVTTVMMPYASAMFACRAPSDRPKVIPDNSKNFAFMGQFVEIPEDVVFTVEYSVRCGMIAAYHFLNIDRKIPNIYHGLLDPKVGVKALGTAFK